MPDTSSPLDRDLLEAWAAGDKRAGQALYRRHRESVGRFLFNKVGDDAADLLQKTFLAAQTSATSYHGSGSARAWLLGIAYRVVCQHLRAVMRSGGVFDDELHSVADHRSSPSTAMGRNEQHRLLLEALRRLPLALQAVIELYYWEGMNNREIAEALSLPLGTVQTRMRRARELLEEALRREDPRPPGTAEKGLDDWASQVRIEVLGA